MSIRQTGDALKERGATVVEFALVMPLLLLLIFGIVEFGRFVAVSTALASASREAARYGSALGDNGSGTPRYVDCNGIRAAARVMHATLLSLSDADIRISYDDGASPVPVPKSEPCPPHGTGPVTSEISNLDRVVVEVRTTFQTIVPIVSRFLGPVTLTSRDARTIFKE